MYLGFTVFKFHDFLKTIIIDRYLQDHDDAVNGQNPWCTTDPKQIDMNPRTTDFLQTTKIGKTWRRVPI